MIIELSPIRSDETLALHRAGEVLTINGLAHDFAPLPEGAVLPRAALDCPWIAGDVTRQQGRLHLALVLPLGPGAAAEACFPAALDPVPEGDVALPGQTGTAPLAGPGGIDWARLVLPDPAADLRAARAAAEARLLERIATVAEGLTGPAPLAEKLSWSAKEEAARAHAAGTAGPEQRALLDGEAALTGENPADLAARILRNADAWRQAVAWLSGLRRSTLAAMARAADPATVAAALAEGLAALEHPPG